MDKLEQLLKVLDGHSKLLIIPHNDPDPDSIATSVALRHLVAELYGVEAQIKHHGLVGRAENKALVRYLRNPLKKLNNVPLDRDIPIALIDTQPGAGNHPLPKDFIPTIVIDHHNRRESSSLVPFVDIRIYKPRKSTSLLRSRPPCFTG
jgi:nanoRNase/pAp phosphatase (c-di-AMP/oligoRNAs hydrolase)